MRSILYMREYLGYMSTLDKLTYVIVELRSVPKEFRGIIPKAFTKSGYTCRAIQAQTIRIHLMKRLCAGLMSLIEFETYMSLLLNHNPTYYAKIQFVDTFVYVQS